MRVLVRIVGILLVTAAVLTWGILALGWSDLFNLPGFESAQAPASVPAQPADPIAKAGAPRTTESAKTASAQPSPAITVAEIARKSTRPDVPALPGPVMEKPAAAPLDRATERAAVQPASPPRETSVPQLVTAEPEKASSTSSTAKADPPRARVAAVPDGAVTASTKPPVAPVKTFPAGPPRVAIDTQPPRVRPKQEARPGPKPAQQSAPAPANPSPERKWMPTRRIAGYGADALVDRLDDPRRSVDDQACVVFEKVQFRPASARPLRAVARELNLMAGSLEAVPNGRVEIGSRIGTTQMNSANLRLSVERARFVRDGLVARGIAADRLTLDIVAGYHGLVGDDLGRMGIKVAVAPSIGVCVTPPIP